MIQVDLFVQSRFPVDRKKVRSHVIQVLRSHGYDHVQLELSVVGSRKIKQLNESQLQHEGTTDVLSFPLHERHQLADFPLPPGLPPHLGDIVISYPAAVENAKRYHRLVDDQICFFAEHAVLHLLGYHHQ